MKFALQVHLHDGSTHHLFGSGAVALEQSRRIRDGWQDRSPDDYYTFVFDGRPTDVFVRDIRDVKLVAP